MSSADRAPLNIAVLGLGFMGSTHVKALRAVRDARLSAVMGNDPRTLDGDFTVVRGNLGGAGEKFDFSLVRKYRDVDSLLADPAIDAVDLCLPTNLHAPIAIAAMQVGKHVLCEKPMALTAADALAMLETAETHGRTLMIAHVLRFFPQYVALRDAVRGGQLGPVRAASFRRRCAAPGWGGWLLDPARSGGGVFDLLIHDVDMSLHLFGVPDSVSATGYTDAERGIDCLDGRLLYASGLVVNINGGWFHPEALPFSMKYTVTLDGGTIDWSSTEGGVMLYGSDRAARPLAVPDTDAYAAEIGYFVECCRGRKPEMCPPRESAEGVSLMRLLEESRRRKGENLPCRI